MKTLVLSIATTLFCLSGWAQSTSNVEVFAQNGEPFYLVLNGVKQNKTAETNVTVKDIKSGNYNLKVVFDKTTLGDLDKNFPLEDGKHYKFRIKNNRKEKPVLRYFGETPISQAEQSSSAIAYHETEVESQPQEMEQTTSVSTRTPGNDQGSSTTTTTTTETTESKNGEGANVNMNVNINGHNMNMGVSVEDDGSGTSGASTNTTTTTTTTSTTSSTSSTSSGSTGGMRPPAGSSGGTSSSSGCVAPSDDTKVNDLYDAVKSESFADDKMLVATQGSERMCLEVNDVIKIGELFSFEEDRLEWAKTAYSRTYNQDEYYKVNALFDFSDSKQELQDFIDAQ